MEGDNQLDGWFTYLVFILFAGTASFWVSGYNIINLVGMHESNSRLQT